MRLIQDILGLPPKAADADAPDSIPTGLPPADRRYQLAAIPAAAIPLSVGVWRFGMHQLGILALAFAVARLIEVATARSRLKQSRGGALTFALLLALVLPAGAPWWMVVAGAAFGVLIGKEVFGGTGHQVFNPVLVGQAFLLLSWPTLAAAPSIAAVDPESTLTVFGSAVSARMAMGSAFAVGGLLLLVTRAVDLRIPVGVVATACLCTIALQISGVEVAPGTRSMILGDGFLFGALLIAGDPTTSPRIRAGRWISAVLVGLVAAVLRTFTANPGAMVYAVLLGNMASPTLDALTVKQPATGAGS